MTFAKFLIQFPLLDIQIIEEGTWKLFSLAQMTPELQHFANSVTLIDPHEFPDFLDC